MNIVSDETTTDFDKNRIVSKLKPQVGSYVRFNRGVEAECDASYGFIIKIYEENKEIYCKTKWIDCDEVITSPPETKLIVLLPPNKLTTLLYVT